MTLARKGLLAHIQMVMPEAEMTESCVINDINVLELIAQGIALEHHTQIWSTTTDIQACITLRDFYNRTSMRNRVTLTRRLHDFKMDNAMAMTKQAPRRFQCDKGQSN